LVLHVFIFQLTFILIENSRFSTTNYNQNEAHFLKTQSKCHVQTSVPITSIITIQWHNLKIFG